MLNIFDIGLILVLISFIIVGAHRGVIKELVSLVGLIVIFVLSWQLKGIIGNILCIYLPFFEFKGSINGISSLNIMLYQLIAFLIVFGLLLGIYTFTLKLSRIVQKIVNATIILVIPSKILGGLVSFIKGYLIVFIISVILIIPFGNVEMFRDSTIINFVLYKIPLLSRYTSTYTKPISDIIDLSRSVKGNNITSEEANQKAIDIMIEYKVVDSNTIDKLKDSNKI